MVEIACDLDPIIKFLQLLDNLMMCLLGMCRYEQIIDVTVSQSISRTAHHLDLVAVNMVESPFA